LDTGTQLLGAIGGLLVVAVGLWAAIHNNGEHVRMAAGLGSSFSPAMRRFSGIVVVLAGLAISSFAVAQLLRGPA